MNTRDFLQAVLGSEGYYCLFAARSHDDRLIQRFYTQIDDMVSSAEDLDAEDYDTYFGLATFTEDNNRKGDNANELKCFFLDIDCGPSKEYDNQTEGLKALRDFCKALRLPKPYITSSGGGLHVYWGLAEAVKAEEWFPVAKRLKQVCAEHGLLADPAVTSDLARVLRIPDTHNYKTSPPNKVQFLNVPMAEPISFDKFKELIGYDNIHGAIRKNIEGYNEVQKTLMNNMKSSFKRVLTAGCEQIEYIVKKQEEIDEPLWRAGLSIAKFCEDGDKAIHKISHKHPDYSPEETEEKASYIKGPYTCAKFDEYRSGVCTKCPHWGKIKSPITLGNEVAATEGEVVVHAASANSSHGTNNKYVIREFPKPYFRGTNGGVYLRSSDSEGNPVDRNIFPLDFYAVERIRDAEIGDSMLMRLHLPHDGVREMLIPLGATMSRDEFRKHVSRDGIAVPKLEELMQYVINWNNELQMKEKITMANKQFGWVNDDLMLEFVLGDRVITAHGIYTNAPSKQTIPYIHEFTPVGSYEVWREAINYWNKDIFLLQQFGLCCGFGSVLMPLTNVHGGCIHFYSMDSGLGKTLILKSALGIWGNPEEKVLMSSLDDTQNSKMNKPEVFKNIVHTIDEISNITPSVASTHVYGITQGRQKSRMSAGSNLERYRGAPWKLISLSTGNMSILELLLSAKAMPKAEAQRILECVVPRIFPEHPKSDQDHKDKIDTQNFEKKINNNYGHAGPKFIEYVIHNKEEVEKIFEQVQINLDRKAELSSTNRFWSANIAAVLTGAIIAKKLDLIPFDTGKIFNWCIDVLIAQNRDNSVVVNKSVEEIMNDFFSENISNILQIKSTIDRRSGNDNGLDDLVIPEHEARNRLVARYETDTRMFFIRTKELREWCNNHSIVYSDLVDKIIKNCEGKHGKVRLAKGTKLTLPVSNVLIMKFSEHVNTSTDSSEQD